MLRPTLLAATACLALSACGGGAPDDDRAGEPERAASLSPAGQDGDAADPALPGELLVRLRAVADLDGVLASHGLVLLDQFGSRPIYRLGVAPGDDPARLLPLLLADPRVVRAERNRTTSTPEGRRRSVWAIGEASQYTAQWAPQAIGLAEAHGLSTGSGVRIAVLDTGVDARHPALAGRLVAGRDFVDGDADPSEAAGTAGAAHGHGTHVAGLLALVAPGATLMPLRVLDAEGRGNVWVVGEALLHAVDPDGVPETADGAGVVNLSLGTTERTGLLADVIGLVGCRFDDDDDDDDDADHDDDDDDEDSIGGPATADAEPDDGGASDEDRRRCAAQGGSVVIAAAGNDGSRDIRQYPAAEGVAGSLAVGATAPGGGRAAFSNFGSWVGIAAPGEGITSSVPGGGWGVWSGTSMSTPLVAGVAALLRAAEPGLNPAEVAQRLAARAVPLCDGSLHALDAPAALRDQAGAAPPCP